MFYRCYRNFLLFYKQSLYLSCFHQNIPWQQQQMRVTCSLQEHHKRNGLLPVWNTYIKTSGYPSMSLSETEFSAFDQMCCFYSKWLCQFYKIGFPLKICGLQMKLSKWLTNRNLTEKKNQSPRWAALMLTQPTAEHPGDCLTSWVVLS